MSSTNLPQEQADARNRYQDSRGNWLEQNWNEWSQSNYIDDQGMLQGDFPVVPWRFAREYQMRADMATDRRRQSYMQGGINYGQGALGLLQSYRPGGSAALESGQYNQLAQMMFNRAQMTRPLDYMGDLRRHEQSQIESRNRRASDRALYTRIGTTLVQAAATYFGGAAGGAIAGIAGNALGAVQQHGASGSAYSGNTMGAYSGYQQRLEQNQVSQMGRGGSPYPQGPAGPGAPGGQQAAPAVQGGPAAQAAPAAGGGAQGLQMEQEGAADPMGQPAQEQQAGGAEGGPGGPGAEGAPGGMGGGMASPMGGGFGVDGDFTTQGMAAASSRMAGLGSLEDAGERIGLMDYAADLYETDPFHNTYGAAVNTLYAEILSDMAGGAA